MPNQYSRDHEAIYVIGPSIAYLPLTLERYALVDWDDAAYLSQWHWQCHHAEDRNTDYAFRGGHWGKPRGMHQLLLAVEDGMFPDHANRNGLDNRRSNLRPATTGQNAINKAKRRDNTSGIVGVSRWTSAWGKDYWKAQARVNGRTIVRTCKTFEEAVAIRRRWEQQHYGEFAP